MMPFFNSRTKRNTAFVVLWVWLFALASGAANACLIQAEELHDHGSRAAHSHSSPAEEGHAISAAHGHAIPDHDSGLEASKSQCLKVCDDGSQSLSKQRVGFDLTHADLTPLFAVAWTTATPVVSARDLAVIQRPPDPGFPIRIRLSRLAL
jgi:hypothetical protein